MYKNEKLPIYIQTVYKGNVDFGGDDMGCINVLIKRIKKCIPFIACRHIPNKETIDAIKEVELLKANPTMGKTYDNVDEMIEAVLCDDETVKEYGLYFINKNRNAYVALEESELQTKYDVITDPNNEDKYDLMCYEEAIKEFKQDPTVYTLEEVENTLKLQYFYSIFTVWSFVGFILAL